jgi:hypothetical protein
MASESLNLEQAVQHYFKTKGDKIVHEEIMKAQESLRKRMEQEALKIALTIAQSYRVLENAECITISVVKK